MSKLEQVTFGKCLLLDILKARGITMTQLADDLGYHITMISAIANNRRKMSFLTAVNIARYLRISPLELYEWK